MLRHPFHGVIGPAATAEEISTQERGDMRGIARRTFFGRVLASIAGVGAFFLTRPGLSQTPPDGGRGIGFPEGGALQGGYGGGIKNPPPASGPPTTLMLGEEGGGPVTTQALGEEGGSFPPPRRRRRVVTTFALGEEGGRFPPQRVTTYALGEEGGGYNFRR